MRRRIVALGVVLLSALPVMLGAKSHRSAHRLTHPAVESPPPSPSASPSPSPVPTPTVVAGPQSRAELEVFVDGLLGGLMPERHVPGAVVLVVKNGEVFFSKGYGFADIEDQRPVDPETLFRVASVSKLFTATAVMQLVEAHKLDLRSDVNTYLNKRFTMKEPFGEVTVADLLTHTGGFDDRLLGAMQPLDAPPVRLGEYLAQHMPPQVMPPGEAINYSNHGYALAGYLVERASGQPFAEYAQEHILEPLDMRRSGFGLPNPLPAELAVPYAFRDGQYQRMEYDRLFIGPAGDLYTSAADIAHFMVAHLQDGRFGTMRILEEETARQMHRQQFTPHSRLHGWCYGFMEGHHNDLRTIEHAGDWRGFGAWLVLVPEANLGIFIATNRDNDLRFFTTVFNSFFDRYFPRRTPLKPPRRSVDAAARAELVSGSYIPVRRMRGDFLKLGLLRMEFNVAAAGDNIVFHLPNDALDPIRLTEIDPLLYRDLERGGSVSFHTDAFGHVDRMFFDWLALDKIGWIESPRLHAIATGVCGLLFLASIIGWVLGWFFRRTTGGPASSVPQGARRLGFIVSFLDVVFLAGLVAVLLSFTPYRLFEGAPPALIAVCAIPLLSLPLSLGLPYYLLRSLTEVGWTPLAWLHYLLLTLAAGLFAGLVYYWNLLGVGLQLPFGPWH